MEKRGKITQLRRVGGIQELIRKVGGTSPQLYHQDEENRSGDGVPIGKYNVGQILDTKQYICPMYDISKKRWSWSGTNQELAQMIIKTGLKYEKGHHLSGTLISEDKSTTPGMRLRDRKDGFFNHSAFYNKLYISDDRVSFDQDNPVHEFLWKCQLGRRGVNDLASKQRVSKFDKAFVRLEAVAPSQEARDNKERVQGKVKSSSLLAKIEQNSIKLNMVATALQLPTYVETASDETLYMNIYSEVIDGEQNLRKKYNNRTIQQRFIELCEMPPADLSILANVYRALSNQIIVRRKSGYLINGILLEGVDGVYALGKYFLLPENQEKYLEVADSLGEDAF